MRHALRSRTYQKFLFSFCLLSVLLAIAFSSLLRGIIQSSAESGLRSSSGAAVRQSAFYIDKLLNNLDTISATISTAKNINNYSLADTPDARSMLIQGLWQYQNYNSMIADIFYIPVRSPFLMSGKSTYTLETFVKLYQRRKLTRERIEELLHQSNVQGFTLLDDVADAVQDSGPARQVVSIVYSLPNGAVGKYALLLFDIRADRLADVLEVYSPDGHSVLLDETGGLLCVSGGLSLTDEEIALITAQTGGESFGEVSLSDSKYYVSAIGLQHNWKLLYLIPKALLARESLIQQAQFLLYFVVVTGLGLLMAFVLSFWNYRPIGRLSRDIVQNVEPSRSTDDLKNIEQRVQDIVSKSSTLQARLEHSRPAVLSQHLLNLINNRYSPADAERLREDGLRLRYGNYVVVLFAPRNADIIHKDGGWIAQLQSCIPNDWDSYFVEYHPSRLYIGLLAFAPMEESALRARMEAIRLSLPSPAAVSISQQTDALFNLAPAFIQSQIALQQRFYAGYNHVYLYEESTKPAMDYPHARLKKLNLALNAKNASACQKEMNALFSFMQSGNYSLETAYCICFEILGELMRHLVHSSIPPYDIERLLPDIVQITRSETLEEIQQLMNEALEASFDVLNSPQEAAPSSLPDLQQILSFMDHHCFRSDFSVQAIADHFGISYPYLGKYFKSLTGNTLNKYVQEQRIAQARRLLTTTDLSLTEIVEQVGYIDLSSFIKLFKQSTGMTPIAFRKLYR